MSNEVYKRQEMFHTNQCTECGRFSGGFPAKRDFSGACTANHQLSIEQSPTFSNHILHAYVIAHHSDG